MGPPRKLYIDSHFRNAGGSSSDFQVTLAQSIEVPDSTVAFVDSVHILNSFTTIHARNRNLYLAEYVSASATAYKTVQLSEGSYNGVTLAAELKSRLDANTQTSATFTVVYQESTGQLTVSSTVSFKFLKEENLDTALQTHVGQVSIGEMTRVSQFSWAIMVHGNATCRGDRG